MINVIRSHKKISIIIMIILFIIIFPFTLSKYKESTNIKVKTTTGEIVYDIKVDKNNKYVEDDITYIIVTINNYKIKNNIKYINSVDYSYELTIKNKSSSNGLFSLDKKSFNDTITYTDEFSKDEDSKDIKVYVKSKDYVNNKVEYNIELKASQKNMGVS